MCLYGLNATNIDYKKGVEALELAVKLKAAGATSLLATCWWNGWGVPESGTNAARLWSGLDDMYSQLHYAVRMRKGDYGVQRDIDLATAMWDSAFPALRTLADNGDARAAHEVANWLYGFGSKQDACRYYGVAADQGHASAQNTLAVRFEKADGVERDLVRAALLAQNAAHQGLAVAQFNLANYYAKGSGIPMDRTRARQWYTAAAQQGDPDAQRKLFEFID
jgi:TPR repeat protein